MGNKKRFMRHIIFMAWRELTAPTIMPNCAIFAYHPVTRVNNGYGICGTGGTSGPCGFRGASGGGKGGIADGCSKSNVGHDIQPMLARLADASRA